MMEQASFAPHDANNQELLSTWTNRQMFPNHSPGIRTPSKDSTLSKIWEKQEKLKAAQEPTNENAAPSSH